MKARIDTVQGRAIPLPGDDIDTDQIIESRYMKAVTFRGIEAHLFRSLRQQTNSGFGQWHPFDDPSFAGARILLVNRNFGCGSSREHAAQALLRFGIRAVVGESFGEIFAGNCVSIGLPCITVGADEARWLQHQCSTDPQTEVVIDIVSCILQAGTREIAFGLPEGRRQRLLDGTWSSLDVLISRQAEVDAKLESFRLSS
ncbi:MAG: 3-isopropylmalate dehydratase small subunit [Candidimonas sp.]|nr:3-isopropylmalate dehydratase small subunit [Candidimonas sp.]NYT44316.1 3-isopropylmalate dehydratase small subunit [Alcaligenaceae bacterium]